MRDLQTLLKKKIKTEMLLTCDLAEFGKHAYRFYLNNQL